MTPSRTLWSPAPAPWASSAAELPESVEVGVLGGTLEALATALFLARGGASVALLCPDPTLAGGLWSRDLALAQVGLAEPPERLVLSVGEERCAQLLRFSAESVALLDHLGISGGPLLHASLGEREEADADEALRVLRAAGCEVEALSAEAVQQALGSELLGRGRRVQGDRAVEPLQALARMEELLAEAGVQVVLACPCQEVEETSDGIVLHLPTRTLRTELVVLAEGWRLLQRGGWFEDKLTPTRTQLAATAPATVPPARPAFTAQLGYLFGQASPDGRLLLGGCRWATQHLETWETDDTVIPEAVAQRLDAMRTRLWPELEAASFTHQWSGIMTFTCDNLPIVGPLPGRARIATVTGFNGRPWSLALRAAQALATGLLDGRPEGLPAMMRSDRFL